MNLRDAINSSQIHAAKGYDAAGECVVSIAYYGDCLRWLTGWGGNWAKEWKEIPEKERHKLDELTFRPSGPRPDDDIHDDMLRRFDDAADTLEAIYEDEDDFEPMGDTKEPEW